ncbi:hypothetical protein I314_06147 [Cryptococcus bacillisporus CA1873]|uniref:Uncharacterized protein n=1 Tax=Cryptococcus bacillisporus CA1873 TaxID=1296111 RepID=A0ABR5B3L4_CRYGA|nr:hypothetical protein I314_06147 [Cryptococcus bacillisporus CA1873]|eukprot:KIR58182.1 hypothetical protein I314_06147 [Cryptococcus gattii CA1873]
MSSLSVYDTTSLWPCSATTSPTRRNHFQSRNIDSSNSSDSSSMGSQSTTAIRKCRKKKLPFAKIFNSKSFIPITHSQTLFFASGQSLIAERKNLRTLEKGGKDLLTSLAGVYGVDYRFAKSSFMKECQTADGQREMRKRWDNKVANRDLIKEWAESTDESMKGWGEKEWDAMRERMEEEGEKTRRASLLVGDDVKELESVLARSLMETGTSAGNTLNTTGTSGYSTSRRSTAQGHLEAPFSRITFMPHSGLNESFLDEFSSTSLSKLSTSSISSTSFQSIGSGS